MGRHEPKPRPCATCPFRRNAAPGENLGGDDANGFMLRVLQFEPVPCHESINYAASAWKSLWLSGAVGRWCTGSLIFAANARVAVPRSQPTMPADKRDVFDSPYSFVAHHQGARDAAEEITAMMRRGRWTDEHDEHDELSASRLRFGEYLLTVRPLEGEGRSWSASSPALNVHNEVLRGPLTLQEAQASAIDLMHGHLRNLLAQFEKAVGK